MLTAGSIEKITSGHYVPHPLLQVLTIDKLVGDDSKFYCFLHDGSHLTVPCILPSLPGVSLVKDSIVLLENYSFHHFVPLNQFLIDTTTYKLLFGIVTPQESLPAMAHHEIAPMNLQVSAPAVSNIQDTSQDSLGIANQAGTSSSVPVRSSRPASLPSGLTSPPFKSLSGRRSSSMSNLSVEFTSASALYAKRGKLFHTGRLYRIAELMSQSSWSIQGRIISKSSLNKLRDKTRNWFYFEMNDISGRIKVNAFGKQSDDFFDLIQLDQVYTLSQGKFVVAKAPFNKTGHSIEISLTDESHITKLADFDIKDFPDIVSTYIKIMDLKDVPADSEVNIVGVCISSSLFYKKARRSLLLIDDSSAEIRVSIWNLTPEEFDPPIGSVVVVRGGRMTHKPYGRLLSVSGCGRVELNPDIPGVSELSNWYSIHGKPSTVFSISKGIFGDISSISNLPVTIPKDEVVYTNLSVAIDSATGQVYKACADCSHRVKVYKRDVLVCEECKDTEPELTDQLFLTFHVSDSSGSAEVVAFTDVALELLQKEDTDIVDIEDDLPSLLDTFSGRSFKLNVKTRRNIYHGQSDHIQHSIRSFSEIFTEE